MLKKLRRTIESIVLATSIFLAPAASGAISPKDEVDFRRGKPAHLQWVFDNKNEARAMVLGFNIVSNCLKSGAGSWYNNEGFLGGCVKGALGGSVMFAGEYLASYNKYPMFGASGKLVHDFGVSMSDNVTRGEGMFSQYETDFGPIIFTFNKGLVPDLSFTLTPAYGIVRNIFERNEFDAKKSLYNFTPVFMSKTMKETNAGGHKLRTVMPALVTGNVITYTPLSKDKDDANLSHEMNHILFWSTSRSMKGLVNKLPTEKLHPMLEMEKIQNWWNIGQDLGGNLHYLPMYVNPRTYYYLIPELKAYTMEQDDF